MKNYLMIIVACFAFSSVIKSQITEIKLTPSDGSHENWFGTSVSISGDYALVGAPSKFNRNRTGTAYMYKKDGSNWIELQIINASDGSIDDQFGKSVAISENYAVIGAPYDDDNGIQSGSAYIFRKEGEVWVEETKLMASDAEDSSFFGYSVAIDSDYVIVGAPGALNGTPFQGSAYVFKRFITGYSQVVKLTASDGHEHDFFGFSVSISGNNALVGAGHLTRNVNRIGAAYLYNSDGLDWTEQQKLVSSDGSIGDDFGKSVSISGDYIAIGAPQDDDYGFESGSAYFFNKVGQNYVEQQKLVADDLTPIDFFGKSVTISQEFIIVGAQDQYFGTNFSGAVYIFEKETQRNWSIITKLSREWAFAFGASISVSGYTILVGAPRGEPSQIGAAYVYTNFTTGINEKPELQSNKFMLRPNYPNPFNPITKIVYSIPQSSNVVIKIFDILGDEIETLVNEEKQTGTYELTWNAKGLPSGVYFYQLRAGSFVETKKMVLMK